MQVGDEVFIKGKITGVPNDDLGCALYRVSLYNINDETDDSRVVWCREGECFRRIGGEIDERQD